MKRFRWLKIIKDIVDVGGLVIVILEWEFENNGERIEWSLLCKRINMLNDGIIVVWKWLKIDSVNNV